MSTLSTFYGRPEDARKVLSRAVDALTAETRLWIDVVVAAINDAHGRQGATESDRDDAVRFFHDDRLPLVANSLGLEPDFLRFVAERCGVMATAHPATVKNKRRKAG